MVVIRTEKPGDQESIHSVNELAFGQANEADLVDALRRNADPYISLVAVLNGEIVGHIFFSPVTVESEHETFTAMGLAPMAVSPDHQRHGIGSLLVHEGLTECRSIGHEVVVVLGHADYYPRFGFTPASSKGLRSEYDVPDEVFMVTELRPDALGGRRGLVKYHPEFSKI